MKKFLILLLIIISAKNYAQESYSITMNGIGNFKLGMKKADAEKLLSQEIKLHNLLKEDWVYDTIACSYKDLQLSLVFDRQSLDDKKYDIVLREVMSNSTNIKTPSGITIGDDKLKIINTYEAYTIWIIPDYENNYTTRSKTLSSIWVHGDESGNVIIFHMNMNKVQSVSVTYNENYD